jgi:hypothetical protein
MNVENEISFEEKYYASFHDNIFEKIYLAKYFCETDYTWLYFI